MQLLQSLPPMAAPDGLGEQLDVVNAVFILGRGVAINYGDGQGTLSFRHRSGTEAGQVATGWVWDPRASGVITYLLLWLSAVIPRYLRCESIALDYLVKLLGSEGSEAV